MKIPITISPTTNSTSQHCPHQPKWLPRSSWNAWGVSFIPWPSHSGDSEMLISSFRLSGSYPSIKAAVRSVSSWRLSSPPWSLVITPSPKSHRTHCLKCSCDIQCVLFHLTVCVPYQISRHKAFIIVNY